MLVSVNPQTHKELGGGGGAGGCYPLVTFFQSFEKAIYCKAFELKVVLRPKTTKKIILFFFGFQNYVN